LLVSFHWILFFNLPYHSKVELFTLLLTIMQCFSQNLVLKLHQKHTISVHKSIWFFHLKDFIATYAKRFLVIKCYLLIDANSTFWCSTFWNSSFWCKHIQKEEFLNYEGMLRQYDTSYDLNVLITLRVSRRDYDGRVTAHFRGIHFIYPITLYPSSTSQVCLR